MELAAALHQSAKAPRLVVEPAEGGGARAVRPHRGLKPLLPGKRPGIFAEPGPQGMFRTVKQSLLVGCEVLDNVCPVLFAVGVRSDVWLCMFERCIRSVVPTALFFNF